MLIVDEMDFKASTSLLWTKKGHEMVHKCSWAIVDCFELRHNLICESRQIDFGGLLYIDPHRSRIEERD